MNTYCDVQKKNLCILFYFLFFFWCGFLLLLSYFSSNISLFKCMWDNTLEVCVLCVCVVFYMGVGSTQHKLISVAPPAAFTSKQMCMLRSFAKWCRNNLKHSNICGGSPSSLHPALLAASPNLIGVRSGPPKCSELQMTHKDFYSEHQLTVKIRCIQEKIGARWVTARQIIHVHWPVVPCLFESPQDSVMTRTPRHTQASSPVSSPLL